MNKNKTTIIKRSLLTISILVLASCSKQDVGSSNAKDDSLEQLNAVADMAANMAGKAEQDKGLPHRYQLQNPLPITEKGQWFKNAGLGLFIHWGPASIPDIEDVWRIRQAKKGEPNQPKVVPEDYYNRAPQGFTAEKYDPKMWLDAAKKAGFKYTVLTSKHHDGYTLWPTKHTDLGVQKYLDSKDLLQPYVDAARANDMKVGFYFSAVDWYLDKNYMNYKWGNDAIGWDFSGQPLARKSIKPLPMEIIEQKRQMAFEVMDKYRPDIWWWDTGLPVSYDETVKKYNPDMLFNNRGNFYHDGKKKGKFPGSHYVTPEGFHTLEWQYIKKLIEQDTAWEVCMTFNRSGWFYHANNDLGNQTGNLTDTLYALARIRSWQGNMLLNMSPREDGTLAPANYEAMEKMSNWMAWADVSVFDTKGTHFPEQSNVPITTSSDGKTWYLHARPGEQKDFNSWGRWKKPYYTHTEPGKPIKVQSVPAVTSVTLLRTGETIEFSYKNGELVIDNPPAGPDGLHEVIKLTLVEHK
ncbi:alpha-L-fucosidase [Thalassotalea nanhaiensis]|uniref:alpha-L-fucosidase n=1 Tax=Thalassotalea nanhaiensis TaxID=3065648 RepID=A0ABY9TN65_9GAMM|nr:alpha-L-fucosidase [Colwelliaceae bacterium SQ345]